MVWFWRLWYNNIMGMDILVVVEKLKDFNFDVRDEVSDNVIGCEC